MNQPREAVCRHPCSTRTLGWAARIATLVMVLTLLAACAPAGQGSATLTRSSTTPGRAVPLPHFDHIVVVIEENHSFDSIMSSDAAPYIHALAQQGALFTNSHAVAHPSQPNYLALFAGSTFGLASDACPQQYTGANLGNALITHGLSFVGYSESLPDTGYTGCTVGDPLESTYARKHNPWVDFASVPASSNQPFSAFPQDFSRLPTLAFVVPNQQHDMHSGSIADGDAWLKQHLEPYILWAVRNDSLLVVTWDEDDGSASNQIPTIFAGAYVQAGQYGELVSHYEVLRTLEALEGLPYSAHAASAKTIADVWQA